MLRVFKVGRIGTKEISIEEAEDPQAACYKAGWVPWRCEVKDITDDLVKMRSNGDLSDV